MYREDKATQLAAYLIKKAGGTCNYLTLIKMMYDADREMVLRWGTPMLFDQWVAMKNGPVLSATYDEIKPGSAGSEYWSKHIKTDGYLVNLVADPGDGALSDADIQAAEKGFEDFRDLDYRQAIERAHGLFKEWHDPAPENVRPISYEDMLRANGQQDPEFLNEVRSHCELNELFGR